MSRIVQNRVRRLIIAIDPANRPEAASIVRSLDVLLGPAADLFARFVPQIERHPLQTAGQPEVGIAVGGMKVHRRLELLQLERRVQERRNAAR